MKSDQISTDAGLGTSFYRLIESGRNHLSVSKAPSLYRAFKGKLNLEATVQYLAFLAASEEGAAEAPRGAVLHDNVLALMMALKVDHPFRSFLRRFTTPLCEVGISEIRLSSEDRGLSLFQCMDHQPKMLRDLVSAANLDFEAHRLLSDYDSYDLAGQIQSESYEEKFFADIPTFYKWMFDHLKRGLDMLPTQYTPEMFWKWEEDKRSEFVKYIAVGYRRHVINDKNLSRYTYPYLWQSSFHKANIIFLEPSADFSSEVEAETDFWVRLEPSVRKLDKPRSVTREVKDKINFHHCNDNLRAQLLELFPRLSEGSGYQFNAMWFFITKDKSVIGVGSQIDEVTAKAKTIDFLTFNQCAQALKIINPNRAV